MEISSTIHHQPSNIQLLVLDVVADEKPFFAAVLIGDMRECTATEIGNECLRRLAAAQDQCSNNDQVMLVEIRSPDTARKRVPQVCERIHRHGAAAFFCLDSASYDAVREALNIGTK